MNALKPLVLAASSMLLLVGCGQPASRLGSEGSLKTAVPVDSGAYGFPVQPGMPEWALFNSHETMLAALQVPEATLNAMSTADLVETCLTYPLFMDVFAYDDPQQGFDHVSQEFNGLTELLYRPDAATILLSRYKRMDPSAIDPAWGLKEQGDFGFEFKKVELLLSQEELLNTLSRDELVELLVEGGVKADLKRSRDEIFGAWGRASTARMVGRVSITLGDATASPSTADFLSRGAWPGDVTIDEVLANGALLARKPSQNGGDR